MNREPAAKEFQPQSFSFSKENLEKAKKIIARYPAGRQASAVMPLLDIAQRQHQNWVPLAAMRTIAEMLDMPYIRVYEVATFYTMYNLKPVGKHLIQICRTTPCWLRGSDQLRSACQKKLEIPLGATTADGEFSLMEVECLGACVNAPMVQINDDYYEDLTPELMEHIIDDLSLGKKRKIGSQINRTNSSPVGKWTSLSGKKKAGKK